MTFKDWITLVIALAAAVIAALGYLKNANTKRAEFLRDLHKSFFEDSKYDTMRRKLDNATESERTAIVREESEGSTRFLNFFELVAYFKKEGILTSGDVKALFRYYLMLLNTDGIRDYLRAQDYEELDSLLGMMKKK
jgi:hypothetical protein